MAIQYICGSSELPIEYNYVLSVLCGIDPIMPEGYIGSAEVAKMIQVIEEYVSICEIPNTIINFANIPRDPFMEFWATFRSELEEEYPIGNDIEACLEWLRKCEGCVINIVATV
jgi:hypothetical protein